LKAWFAVTVGVLAVLPRLAGADTLAAANWDLLHACGAGAGAARVALRDNVKLQQAANRLAEGSSLQNALASAGYLAAHSSEIRLSGVFNDSDIGRALAVHYCGTLRDAKLQEFGAVRRGRDVWMILAQPVALPAAADAAVVSRRILDLVNAARAAGRRCGGKYFAPVGTLALDPALTRAAVDHSHDMALHDEFDHRGHDGSTPAVRVERAGFGPHRLVGENIAAGAMTPAEVAQGWLASPAHCENIMDGRFTLIGIGYGENLGTRSVVFWTQDFAARR
jgi:uncharacterized protein YkwD